MELWLPIISALLTPAVGVTLTLWFSRKDRRVSLVSQLSQTNETYWRRIQEHESEREGLLAELAECKSKILELEAQVGRLFAKLERYEQREGRA